MPRHSNFTKNSRKVQTVYIRERKRPISRAQKLAQKLFRYKHGKAKVEY